MEKRRKKKKSTMIAVEPRFDPNESQLPKLCIVSAYLYEFAEWEFSVEQKWNVAHVPGSMADG